MKGTIVYLTKYRQDNSFGGMVRVNDIASKLPFIKKVYLEVKLLNIKTKRININEYEEHVIVNPFMLRTIYKILSTAYVLYCHTVGNFIKNYISLKLFNKKLSSAVKVLDWHASQPEEFHYLKKPMLSWLFSYFENKAAESFDYYISVTRSMLNHFQSKYNLDRTSSFVIPITSYELDRVTVNPSDKTSPPIIVYCGGVQGWQNVPEMVQFIRKNIYKNVMFLILTYQVNEFKKELEEGGIDLDMMHDKITIKSARPSELPEYYTKSSYGLLLRDPHVLNRVANPTKLSEYLAYGITPIVKSSEIGDYDSLGYEYISYLDDVEFEARLSMKNLKIFRESQSSELDRLIRCIKNDISE